MNKIFIRADELLRDAFLLAERVYLSEYQPDFIVGVWRGGAPVGIYVQEYLAFMGINADHIAIRTRSYTGIDQQQTNIDVDGMEYLIKNMRASTRLLLVDDVFDSGRSIQAILHGLAEQADKSMPDTIPNTIKVACPWFKPARNVTDLQPDYYIHETDDWLVFPHELIGLSAEEICNGKAHLADTLLPYLDRKK